MHAALPLTLWRRKLGLADVYMIGCMSGRYLINDALGMGWACASSNTPLVIQEIGGGGTLGKALSLHLASVLPTCTGPMICLDDQYEDPFCERRQLSYHTVGLRTLRTLACHKSSDKSQVK